MNNWTIVIGIALAKGAAFSLAWLLLGSLRPKASAAWSAMWWRVGIAGWIAVESVALLPSVWNLRVPRTALPLLPVSEVVEVKTLGIPQTAMAEEAPLQSALVPTGSPSVVTPAAIRAASPPSRMTFSHWVGLSWLMGMLVCMLRFSLSVLRVKRLCRHAIELDDEHWLRSLRDHQHQRGIERTIDLLAHDTVAAPFATGWRRPAIVLPAGAREWDAAKREAVLRHEFAHIARHDIAWMWFASVVAALHWFSPPAWKLRSCLTLAQERAADDVVLDSGVQGVHYAELLAAAARESSRLANGPALVSMARRSTLGQRVGRVLDAGQDRSSPGAFLRIAILILVTASVSLIGLTGLRAATGTSGAVPPAAWARRVQDTYRLEETFGQHFAGTPEEALKLFRAELAAGGVSLPERCENVASRG